MKFNHKVFTPTLFFCFMGFFFLYWITAFPAEMYLMDERGGDAFGRSCYELNQSVFFLQDCAYEIGLDEMIGAFPTLLVVIFIMSLIVTYVIQFLSSIAKLRKDR